MSVVDGSEASITKQDGDEKEAAVMAIPINNSEPDERKARMALMVAKLHDADHQNMVDYAEEVGSRLDKAITKKSEWEQIDDRGVPSEKKMLDVELSAATDESKKATKLHREARGDYAGTCPPSQATNSYEPKGDGGASSGVEADKARPGDKKPWLLANPTDPKALNDWYTPARYFARQYVLSDRALLTKKPVLANKVSNSLANAGIYKRGGKKPFDAGTVLKAFSNVQLG